MLPLRSMQTAPLLLSSIFLLVAGCAGPAGMPAPVEHRDLTSAGSVSSGPGYLAPNAPQSRIATPPRGAAGQMATAPSVVNRAASQMTVPAATNPALAAPLAAPQFSPAPQVVTEAIPQTRRVQARPLTPGAQTGVALAAAQPGPPVAATNVAQPVTSKPAPGPAATGQSSNRSAAVGTAVGQPRVALAPAAPKTPAPVQGRPVAKAPAKTVVNANTDFIWPATGTVVESFKTKKSKGIGIAGRAGDPIAAAADGEVIFSGLGPRGYGKLLIVKHKKEWLSVYAHNANLLVQEGQAVRQGQTIAELGSTGTDRPKLHFEIRRQGKPVDPLAFLPNRR